MVSLSESSATVNEAFLLALLNSTPVVDGSPTDQLADPEAARAWTVGAGGLGSTDELAELRRARAALQGVVRGELKHSALRPLLRGVSCVPQVDERINWLVRVAPERELTVRAILAFNALDRDSPGRLRPCANEECRLFLIDRSPANRARWCSMTVCGNRMKARRHYQRERAAIREQAQQDHQAAKTPHTPEARGHQT